MKKILSVLFFALALTTSVWADDVISRDVKKLPVAAQNFIKKNFPKSKVSYIKIDKDLLEAATYEAILEDGVQIDFNNKGEWTEIDCKLQPVPAALIPATIATYLKNNYPNEVVEKIERDRKGYEVELKHSFTLKFNTKGQFLRLDD